MSSVPRGRLRQWRSVGFFCDWASDGPLLLVSPTRERDGFLMAFDPEALWSQDARALLEEFSAWLFSGDLRSPPEPFAFVGDGEWRFVSDAPGEVPEGWAPITAALDYLSSLH